MDVARPYARAVAVGQGRILAVGSEAQVRRHRRPTTAVIDCGGRALLPAFIDPHCHLLAYAASLGAVDCRPGAVASIADIQTAIRRRAAATPPGRWLRAFGYSETELAEGRHPTRWELDAASPSHPVRLIHRSGHACVLNSLALRLCGIGIAAEEPPGGYLEREAASGEPSGLLLEMDELVERAVPPLAYHELATAVAQASRQLLAWGVAALQDMTAGNGPADLALLQRLRREGHLRQHLVAAVGYQAMDKVEPGAASTVKVAIKELGDEIYPDEAALAEMVAEAHARGFQVAVHAVEERAIAAAVAAFEGALARRPRPHHHRIEHCGLCPPELARRIGALGLTVVTQPAFLYHSGDRYLRQVPPEKQPYLYPLRSLARAGARLAASSDCPVAPPDPLAALYGAVARRSRRGQRLPGAETVDVATALAMHTREAARAAGLDGERGIIAPGLAADLMLLSADPAAIEVDALLELRVEMTMLAGEVAWRARV